MVFQTGIKPSIGLNSILNGVFPSKENYSPRLGINPVCETDLISISEGLVLPLCTGKPFQMTKGLHPQREIKLPFYLLPCQLKNRHLAEDQGKSRILDRK